MNGRRSWFCCALPLGALALAGCQHCCGTQSCYSPPPAVVRSAYVLPAHPLAPCQACQVPPTPPGANLSPPVVTLNPPAPINHAGGAFQPMPGGPLQPAGGPTSGPEVSLGVPVPIVPERQRESARPNVPQSPEPPKAPPLDKGGGPDGGERPRSSPVLPVGIANFAEAMPGVASGLRPLSIDGVDWLKTNGYKAVLLIRAPGEVDDGDRRLMGQRGLKYLSLQLSPKTLIPEVVEAFNKIVADPANRPLFVYDKDGSLAGALWYLHFRTADKLPDDEARKKAAALGLKEDTTGPNGDLLLAIQAFVRDNLKP